MIAGLEVILGVKKRISFAEEENAMTITDQFRECFKDVPIGTRFTRLQIIDLLHEKYGTNETSIIPSDHS